MLRQAQHERVTAFSEVIFDEILNAKTKRNAVKETLIKSFDELRTSGKLLIPFMVSLSNHEGNQLNQSFLK
jgi:hypothetical protein